MKRKVHFSLLCKVITIAAIGLLTSALISAWPDGLRLLPVAVIFGLMMATGLYYCPVAVAADDKCVRIHRLLSRPKTFAYTDIASAGYCYPSGGGLRLCGSGGFFGFWGYFHDIAIGSYFGYYGDRSQCFCIRLKNGRQYVVSCRDSEKMSLFIESHI